MTMRIVDPEASLLARLLDEVQATYVSGNSAWDNSPFAGIRTLASRQKGAVAERLLSAYMTDKGFRVDPPPDRECDRLINGVRTEIKMSTLWQSGLYRFQQFRDQNYDLAICLGISPTSAHCWAIPKSVIHDQRQKGGIPSQHAGSAGRDTAWLHVNPEAPPAWLCNWGGSLSDAVSVVARLVATKSRA